MQLPLLTAFGLGFAYFISAIPAAVLAGAPLGAAAVIAWCGYSAGCGLVLLLGEPIRLWLIKKFSISFEPNEKKLFWRIWNRYGLIGLGLIAPVTIGPQLSALLLLALGERPKKILVWISLGAIPWAVGFAIMVKIGSSYAFF